MVLLWWRCDLLSSPWPWIVSRSFVVVCDVVELYSSHSSHHLHHINRSNLPDIPTIAAIPSQETTKWTASLDIQTNIINGKSPFSFSSLLASNLSLASISQVFIASLSSLCRCCSDCNCQFQCHCEWWAIICWFWLSILPHSHQTIQTIQMIIQIIQINRCAFFHLGSQLHFGCRFHWNSCPPTRWWYSAICGSTSGPSSSMALHLYHHSSHWCYCCDTQSHLLVVSSPLMSFMWRREVSFVFWIEFQILFQYHHH